MRLFNWTSSRRSPDQRNLGDADNMVGSLFGISYTVDEYNLYSQIKDYRTDLLNGTEWVAVNATDNENIHYLQFFKLLSKYSTAIFNDFCKIGFTVFAKIDDKIFYVSSKNYTKSDKKITIHGFPGVEVFVFDEPNAFCGEKTIFQKCEPYQKLYNTALSCQKNGMTKSGFVNIMSPKNISGSNTPLNLTDAQIKELEKDISVNHGIATNEQNNILLMRREMNVQTISYDFSKLGILQTKKLCEEFVCSKLGVPFVLLPSEGQTFANYEEANKILYENHSKYCEFFVNFVKMELGLNIDYKTIAEAGKGIV